MEQNNWIKPHFFNSDYTMIVLPDTQNIIERTPELYFEMMGWIKNNKEKFNIKAVLHMGDIVNRNTSEQWIIAKEGFDILRKQKIPFMPMIGNHDDRLNFNKYFDYQTYGLNNYYFGGSFDNTLSNTYWFIEEVNRKYLILTLEFGPSIDVINWAKDVIIKNKDKNVIFTTHAYMYRNNRLLLKDDMYSITSYPGYENYLEGNEIWDMFSKYENVVLGMSGHISCLDVSRCIYNNKYSLLFDNQDNDKKEQLGMIGILSFKNNENIVGVNWYSIKKDMLYKEDNQFNIMVNHIENGE